MKAIQKDSNHIINYNKLMAHLPTNLINLTIRISLKIYILLLKCQNLFCKKRKLNKNHNLKENKA